MRNVRKPLLQLGRRLFAFALVALLLLGTIPVGVYAQSTESTPSETTSAGGTSLPAESTPTDGGTEDTTPTEQISVQEQLNALLDSLRVYIDKTPFFREDLEALNSGLEQAGKFCADNGITELTAEQQELWNQLAQATMQQLDASYAAKIVTGEGEDAVTAYYVTLQEAIDAATEGATVTLQKDIQEAPVEIGKSITLDLNGSTFYMTEENSPSAEYSIVSPDYALLIPGCNVTIADSSESKGGTISALSGYHALRIMGPADVTVDAEITISGNIFAAGIDTSPVNLTLNAASVSGALVLDPGNAKVSVTKATGLELDAPDGFYWENDQTLTPVEYIASVDDIEKKFTSMQDAINEAPVGGTVRLLANVYGDSFTINKSLTLDLGNHTYTFYTQYETSDLYDYSPVVRIEPNYENDNYIPVSATIQNGTITSTMTRYLVANSQNLTLSNVTLQGRTEGNSDDPQILLYSENGVVNLTGKTSIVAASGDYAMQIQGAVYESISLDEVLEELYSGIGYGVRVSDSVSISGTIGIESQLFFALNHANLENCILQMPDGDADCLITKASDLTFDAPMGYYWETVNANGEPATENDTETIDVLKRAEYVAEYTTSDNTTGYSDYLSDAISNAGSGGTVTLLTNVALSSPIQISEPLTLDLNGFTISCDEVQQEQKSSGIYSLFDIYNTEATIKNGVIRSSIAHSIIISDGQLTLKDIALNATSQDSSQFALWVCGGSTTLSGDTSINTMRNDSLALYAAGYQVAPCNATITVNDNSNVTVSGIIGLFGGTGDSITLNLNQANLEESSLVIETEEHPIITKDINSDFAAPAGYTWSAYTDPNLLQLVKGDPVASVSDCGDGYNGDYYSLLDAINAVNLAAENEIDTSKATVTLLQDITVYEAAYMEASINLDLNGKTWNATTYEEDALYIAPGINVTVKNGSIQLDSTFYADDNSPYAAVYNEGNLTLENVTLTGEQDAAALFCVAGTAKLVGSTLTANGNAPALIMLYAGDGKYSDILRVSADDASSITGAIQLDSMGYHRIAPTDMVLNLDTTKVSGPLVLNYDANDHSPTITKTESCKLLAPSSFFWKKDKTLTPVEESPDMATAIAVGDGEEGFEDEGVYYSDLKKALNNSAYVKLLDNLSDESIFLEINNDVTLDLDGKHLHCSGIINNGYNLVIKNGSISVTVDPDDASGSYLEINGGSVRLENVTLGKDGIDLPDYGVIVSNSQLASSSFTMTGSTIAATQAGILVEPNTSTFGGANTVTVNADSEIHAQCGIADLAPAVQTSTDSTATASTVAINVNGGLVSGSEYGIQLTNGTLHALGGSITGQQAGIFATAANGNVSILLNGAEVTAKDANPGVQLQSDPASGFTTKATYYAGKVSSILTDANIGSMDDPTGSTELWKGRGRTVSAKADSLSSTLWYDPMDNSGLHRFAFGSQDQGLPITIQWVDLDDSFDKRPDSITATLSVDGNSFAHTIQADSDGDNTWHYLVNTNRSGKEITASVPKVSYYKPAEVTVAEDGSIVITYTLNTEVKTNTYSVVEKETIIYISKPAPTQPKPSVPETTTPEATTPETTVPETTTPETTTPETTVPEATVPETTSPGGSQTPVKPSTPANPNSGTLTQTGHVTWPMPLIVILGLALILLGWILLSAKKGRYETK